MKYPTSIPNTKLNPAFCKECAIEKISGNTFSYVYANHLGNVLTVISDKKQMRCPIPDTIASEDFTLNPFVYGQWYSRNSWGRGNSSLHISAGKLIVEDSITSDPHARLNYMLPYDLEPNHTYRVKVDITKYHGTDPWYADIFYCAVQNGYDGTFVRVDTLTTGSNNFTFKVPGHAWRIRFLHHSVAEDIEYGFDNFSIVDITEGESSYYIADVVAATDYSPFGAPLPGRTYNVQDAQNKATIASQDFASGTDSWVATGSSTTVSNVSGQLVLTTTNTATTVSMSKTYTVNTTKRYRLSVDVDAGSVTNATISIIGVGSTLSTGSFTGASHQQIDFIADGGNVTIKIQMGIGTGTRIVYIDNVKLEEIKGDLSGYRLGFNGKENDNEVKGDGNSLDFGERIYDPRLGRWMSLDPLQAKHPSLSPYHFSNNNPIVFKDPDGRDFEMKIYMNEKQERIIEINQTVYTSSKVANDQAHGGAQKWNQLSGTKMIIDGQEYSVKVNIETKNLESINNVNIQMEKHQVRGNAYYADKTKDGEDNKVREQVDESVPDAVGYTIGGNETYIPDVYSAVSGQRAYQHGPGTKDKTLPHEIGHTLGLEDNPGNGGVMDYGNMKQDPTPEDLRNVIQYGLDVLSGKKSPVPSDAKVAGSIQSKLKLDLTKKVELKK